MLPDSLAFWQGPLLPLLVSLAWAALLRGRPLGALALGLGALAGFALILGISLASPRQSFERLPALMAGAVLLSLPLCFLRGRWAAGALAAASVLLGGWWLGGAPLWGPDAARALPVMLAAALAAALATAEASDARRAAAVAALAAALLVLAAPPGPWLMLGLAWAAATGGALASGTAMPFAARVPFALGLAGVTLGPALARGAPGDWLLALAPIGTMLLAPRLAMRGGGWLAFAALAALALLAAWGISLG
ncbi:hypothetical protein [Sabulicella glaciei]|uniref:Uncharacterized protein n=1 Tax=Sabulicella glaciei TaxID=2984948 RepID=A0ABT3NZ91_9PROT|nr:hypothetical protein [Roseococcus sp. MDT2-1-1]MCW8087482.1 hypothetical protein [Roseococcus sp. MDT2-1-1]